MADSALVGKIHGKNPSSEDMEIWVRKNQSSALNYEPEMDALTKDWFGFRFNCTSYVEKIHVKQWSYGAVPILLKKWIPLFDADSERLDTMPMWVHLPGLP